MLSACKKRENRWRSTPSVSPQLPHPLWGQIWCPVCLSCSLRRQIPDALDESPVEQDSAISYQRLADGHAAYTEEATSALRAVQADLLSTKEDVASTVADISLSVRVSLLSSYQSRWDGEFECRARTHHTQR